MKAKTPIRIGIDARFYGPKQKGLGRYVQKLLENLEKEDTANKYIVFLRKENWGEYNPKNPNFKKVLANYSWYGFKEQFFMPWNIRWEKVDLMHFPHFNVPVFYFKPFVVTIHDLILKRFPTRRASTLGFFFYWLKNFAYQVVIFLTIKRAKKIITISNYTKGDISRYFNVNPKKIEVIYEGVPYICFLKNKYKGRPRTYKGRPRRTLINKPYLLYVGNAYPHKNLKKLILAFDKLNKDGQTKLQLVLAGETDFFYRRLQKEFSGIQGVIFADFVSDEELEILYRNAALYVFPSACEGFGLPPLEAMSYGLPVASSNATCLPEVLGKAAVYFNPENINEMAEKIKQVLEDGKIQKGLISKGYKRIKKYDWTKMTKKTIEVYDSIA